MTRMTVKLPEATYKAVLALAHARKLADEPDATNQAIVAQAVVEYLAKTNEGEK